MRVVTGLVLLLGITACGGAPPRAVQPELPSVAPAAMWATFPVDRRPRPIVLTSPAPELAGFTTDAAKKAAVAGNYAVAGPLPAAPPTVTAQLPDGPAEFPTLSAEAALGGLRRAGQGPAPDPAGALPIMRVELGTAEFGTDRGRIALPAWLFHPADALGPIAWPALPDEAFWSHGQSQGMAAGGARRNADGTLTVALPAPPTPCPGEQEIRYEPVVTETVTTVSVTVRSDRPEPPGNCARDLMLRYQDYQVRLAAPLGNRVLIDERGAPVPVTR